MKENFDVDIAKELGKKNDLDKLSILITELGEKWGAEEISNYLDMFVEDARIRKAQEIHNSFGSLPK
jgi:hypothetical protein